MPIMQDDNPQLVEATTLPNNVRRYSNQMHERIVETPTSIMVTLDEDDLWKKFEDPINEMIVTKTGRRMFPVIKIKVKGLDPIKFYSFHLDFIPVDTNRWKYVNGEWILGGKAEPHTLNNPYVHPDSPNFGAHWMKEQISFCKVKLTNKMQGQGQIMLNSLHKYQPRIQVLETEGGQTKVLQTFTFECTRFVAVTAYQNEAITDLKIKYNPFAKAFQDSKDRTRDTGFATLSSLAADDKALINGINPWYHLHSQFTNPHFGQGAWSIPNERLAIAGSRPSPYSVQRRSSQQEGTYPFGISELASFAAASNMYGSGHNTPYQQQQQAQAAQAASQQAWINSNIALSQYPSHIPPSGPSGYPSFGTASQCNGGAPVSAGSQSLISHQTQQKQQQIEGDEEFLISNSAYPLAGSSSALSSSAPTSTVNMGNQAPISAAHMPNPAATAAALFHQTYRYQNFKSE